MMHSETEIGPLSLRRKPVECAQVDRAKSGIRWNLFDRAYVRFGSKQDIRLKMPAPLNEPCKYAARGRPDFGPATFAEVKQWP